jgi:putative ABC transport system substrate-binding protein
VKLQPLAVQDSGDLKVAFDAATRERSDALLVVSEAIFIAMRQHITDFAARHRLPAIYGGRTYVEAGALMSYGTSSLDNLRRLGGYVDKILKGATPADLPVQQPTTFELLINMKTAKALGLTIPQSVLVRADKLIE